MFSCGLTSTFQLRRRGALMVSPWRCVIADRPLRRVQADRVDSVVRRDLDCPLTAENAVYLELRQIKHSCGFDARCAAESDNIQPMWANRWRRESKLIRDVSAPSAVISVAVGVRGAYPEAT